MKAFSAKKFKYVGCDDRTGLFEFKSNHPDEVDVETTFVHRAKLISEDGSVQNFEYVYSELLKEWLRTS